ncbi:MAG TPA: TonB-dependent receptor [Chitinophagaceae bacterium]|nr:TonB-dependent receptor [Chitinophagaceae bacterium]MCC6635501.1 TonB-dependent receptor [Chitinophagaceae bacterium]HNE92986.1 TonB-dependent receptor [Chitinophagaceae bacterium]HNF29285.1 TonB-dependent receptor [Chitinophagaceae bacterium]HNM34266.1 TonB-dependent receptor [Chitinophagaceae bacterium]
MKKFMGTLLFLFITAFAFAQKTKITGKVIDEQTNLPLYGATVKLNSLITITDEQGYFIFKNVKKQPFTILVSNIGYLDYSSEIKNLESSNDLIIQLKRQVYFLDALEVTSIRAADKSPFSKNNLYKEQLAKLNVGQDLPFVLNTLPSVVINSDAGNGIGYTGIRIRGTDATRINVTVNGIPFNDAESQGSFFVNMPDLVSSTNTIQVQRGVGTTTNGTGAFGATINLSTNEVIEKPYTEINNTVGSFSTWKSTIKAGTGLLNKHFTLDTRLSKILSNGYVQRASSNLQAFYVSAAYIAKNTSLRLNIFSGNEKTYQAWNGIDEATLKSNRTYNSSGTEKLGEPYKNETDNYKQTHYQLFFNHKANQKWQFNIATFLVRGLGYYENYKANQKFSKYGLPDVIIGASTITKTDLVRQLWLDNYFYGTIFSSEYKKNKTNLTIGGGWSKYDGKHFGKLPWAAIGIEKDYQYYNNPATKTEFNIYSKLQQQVSHSITLFSELQCRNVQQLMNGFRNNPSLLVNRKFDFVNPKIGLTFIKKGWQTYASYAMVGKEPNRDDFEAGTITQPKAEILHNIELGTEKKTSKYNLAANIYVMLYKNQLVLTGKINDVGAYTRINVPKSYRVGIELQGSYVFSNWLSMMANITISKNKIQQFTEYIDDYDNGTQVQINQSNKTIALSPSFISSASINFLPLKNIEFSLIGKFVGKQYLDNTESNLKQLNSFYTQDVRLIYSIKNCNLSFQVNNILNTLYQPNGYTFNYIYGGKLIIENYYFPMAGINFLAGVNIKL